MLRAKKKTHREQGSGGLGCGTPFILYQYRLIYINMDTFREVSACTKASWCFCWPRWL
uniref:Uncharacterized protein n=1 Tax=Myoviridae sp. ctEg02 TaxID=2825061 RepID=A0A8S5PRM7_9CAUD|nr:MAG TPA: hypothetical protein [Myoviridae sp. ctEg02]